MEVVDPKAESIALALRQRGYDRLHAPPQRFVGVAVGVVTPGRRRRFREHQFRIVDLDHGRTALQRLPCTDAVEKDRFRDRGQERPRVILANLVHPFVKPLERVLAEVVRFRVGDSVSAEIAEHARVMLPENRFEAFVVWSAVNDHHRLNSPFVAYDPLIMKAIVAAGAALLLLAGACTHERDTGAGDVWVRTFEPRLTTTRSWNACTRKLSHDHVVTDAQCAVAPIDNSWCNEVIDSRQQANQMLVSQVQCTDASIAALENLSRADAAALSDLAGAYYVRAQRKDNPADLLRAFDAARRAVVMRPLPAGAQFNFALILEALSLNTTAINAWKRAEATEGGHWAEEARDHRLALMRAAAQDGEHQWKRVKAGIDAALAAQDAGKARQLIAAFPAASQRYFEEDVLAQWASSPSPLQVSRVVTFGNALSQFFNDRYFNDVASAVVHARASEDIDRLRKGHLKFAEARKDESVIDFDAATFLYDEAARLLRRAGSPQSLVARISHATQSALVTGDYGPSVKELDAIAADARQYPSVIARVNLNRINADQFSSRYSDLFTAYDAAMAAYGRIGDWEDRAAADARGIAAMSVVGLKERAWRQAFVAMREAPRLLNLRTGCLLAGAASNAALDLDHPEAALLYTRAVLDFARRYPLFQVSALDHLAAIELRLRQMDIAQQHLDEAVRINRDERPGLRDALQARLLEVQGEMAMRVDPGRAIETLTKAIDAASKAEFTTFIALLLARRADAYARVGNPAQAAADRREALKQLHTEEELMLSGRKQDTPGDFWNAYFSRFDEVYDLLIRHLIDDRKLEEAFQHAERARAFEPLDRVRKLPSAPAAFRDLAASSDNVDIAKLRAVLPPGTFLIEYRVFDDQTYAWILGRDVFVGQQLPARRNDVKRWTDTLQNAASGRDSAGFDKGLEPPYDGLLKTPLEIIHRLPGGATANIVIVPDRELRGLPFAALRNPDSKRYVIEDHVLSISASALLYAFAVLRDRDLPSRDASALLIGDPAFDPNSTLAAGLPRLAFAQQEAEQIRPLYPHSEVLIGDAATPQQFLRMAGGKAIIDIAAHAVINGDAPSQSFLLFAKSGAGNGVLNAETLMKELHTDKTRLVVLGACSSAGGLPVGAEGIAPLVRPIIGAGVPGVIGSLWDISDATAAKLLVSFHGNYRKGSDAAKALRDAQLEMLQSSKTGELSVLSWAPFETIGYASSPFASIENMKKEKPP